MASDDPEDGCHEILGPQPLLRHGDGGRLSVQPEGVALLRRAQAPVHLVFAIGGSRCGKSTASNALAFGAEEDSSSRFQTGDTFEPVTAGVDVAVRQLQGGGALVVADCEGAFHIFGSSKSARSFGALGLLAYNVSSILLHVTMGSIDERDVEVLGFLAASSSGDPSAGEGDDVTKMAAGLPPPACKPSLLLLVNGARFDLGETVARRLLRPPEDGGAGHRWSARAAIARGFRGQPVLEALPACEHKAYWPKVNALRSRILGTAPLTSRDGSEASGCDIAERLVSLVAALNGDSSAGVAVALREPEPATEVLYRNTRLEPLVEEISRRFAVAGASIPPEEGDASGGPGSCSVDEALAEFDRRAARLVGGDSGPGESRGSSSLVRDEVVADMRARLAARLQGICEALARGRQQAAKQRRPRRMSAEKENVTPSGPPSPRSDGQKCQSLSWLESSIAEVQSELVRVCAWGEEEVSSLQAAVTEMQQNAVALTQQGEKADRKAASDAQSLQDRWHERFRDALTERTSSIGSQANVATTTLSQLQVEVQEQSGQLPDPRRFAAELRKVRDSLEAGRLQRQEAGSTAAQAFDRRLQGFRTAIEQECSCLVSMREGMSRRISEALDELRGCLEEERCLRRERHTAMAEVVERLRASLEAARVEAVSSPPKRPSSASRSAGIRSRAASATADRLAADLDTASAKVFAQRRHSAVAEKESKDVVEPERERLWQGGH